MSEDVRVLLEHQPHREAVALGGLARLPAGELANECFDALDPQTFDVHAARADNG